MKIQWTIKNFPLIFSIHLLKCYIVGQYQMPLDFLMKNVTMQLNFIKTSETMNKVLLYKWSSFV